MRLFSRFFLVILFMLPILSYATKGCNPLNKSQFMTEIARQSDLVAMVVIQEISPNINAKWTKVVIKEKIYNKANESGPAITINKWRANDEPLFNFKAGDMLVLWLRKAGNNYELTSDNWNYCEPAIWSVVDNKILPAFNDDTNSINTIDGIKRLITESK